jgi:hypothetical protein
MYAKIDGSINPQNITKAFIRGLLKQVEMIFPKFEIKRFFHSLENLSRLGKCKTITFS